MSDSVQISKATRYNWKKLNSDSKGKLTKRANKTQSTKRIVAAGYLDNPHALDLFQKVSAINAPVDQVMAALVRSALSHKGLLQKPHVQAFLQDYAHLQGPKIVVPDGIWDSDDDVLGFVYQSLMAEGERNISGQYYTSKAVVDRMLDGLRLSDNETFLDPCCGSGAFLMGVRTDKPSHLYGFDTDPLAVMIASANLLMKYPDQAFQPRVYQLDFLQEEPEVKGIEGLPDRFDLVCTNPPWGSEKGSRPHNSHHPPKPRERAAKALLNALPLVKTTGTLCFLMPTSLLKTKARTDIRKQILQQTSIRRIDLFEDRFDGVFTDCFSIRLQPVTTPEQSYVVASPHGTTRLTLSDTERRGGMIPIAPMDEMDRAIVDKMERARHDQLTHSQWALGIVTGDNKHKVKQTMDEGMEPVVAGRQVSPFKLETGASFVRFAPEDFQQCAREDYYRAPEKLVYRFIAKYPVVAYDDRQRLCLNSANVLIPQLDSISVKSVAALLNASLYRYYYTLRFPDIKVLKSNLQELPFPKLTGEQDQALADLVTAIQAASFTPEHQKELDRMVYAIFGITRKEQEHLEARLR